MQTWGTWFLIIVSGAVFLADMISGRALLEWGAKSLNIWSGDYYRLITATFLHADIRHLLFNMYALFVFGRVVETVLGTYRFMIVYLLSGATGYMLSLLVQPESTAVGASAAIFGLIGYTLHYRLRRLPLRHMRIDNDLLQIIGINLLIGFLIPRIDQMAHLGGLLGGMAAASLVGMPARTGKIRRNWIEPVLVLSVLLMLTGLALQPVAVAKRLHPLLPSASAWIDVHYGRFFAPLWAEGVELLWSPLVTKATWNPASNSVRIRSDEAIRLATFWRWERGSGSLRPVPYEVTWYRFTPNTSQVVQVDKHIAVKPDPDPTLIYAKSDVVVGPGTYRVQVKVDDRLVWTSRAEIAVKER